MLNNNIKKNQINLLEEIFENQNKEDKILISKILANNINQEDKENILFLIGKELCDNGFDKDDEPNKRGILLEELIDVINKISVTAS